MKVYEIVNVHVGYETWIDGSYPFGDGSTDRLYATRPFKDESFLDGRYLVNVHGGVFGPETNVFSSLTVASMYRDQFDNWDRLTARVKA